ncbi:MAG: translation elongation factor-like protein [Chloroflexi bacterium]|nr:translation elongation factor-like protein [Chloroflexota bacterium]
MEVEVGRVLNYYSHLGVAALSLVDSLKLGDRIHVFGHATDFSQRVTSMEIEHHNVLWVKPGENVAIKTNRPVHVHDIVYRVIEEEMETIT